MTEPQPHYEIKCSVHVTAKTHRDVAWKLYLSHRRDYILNGNDDDHESALWWLGRYLLAGGRIVRTEES